MAKKEFKKSNKKARPAKAKTRRAAKKTKTAKRKAVKKSKKAARAPKPLIKKSLISGGKQQAKVDALIRLGRERGYVTYDEILREFPTIEDNVLLLEEMYEKFSTAGMRPATRNRSSSASNAPRAMPVSCAGVRKFLLNAMLDQSSTLMNEPVASAVRTAVR